jgi:hypothetical protein
LLFGYQIQAEQRILKVDAARVLEYPEDIDFPDRVKACFHQKPGEELLVQSNNVIIILIYMAAEQNTHNIEAFLRREPFPVEQESCQNIEVRGADVQLSSILQYAVPFLECGLKFAGVIQMFNDMGCVNFGKGIILELR